MLITQKQNQHKHLEENIELLLFGTWLEVLGGGADTQAYSGREAGKQTLGSSSELSQLSRSWLEELTQTEL